MKAVICGAGIAGLALAHRLATLGWDVVIAERASGPRAQGYMIDFFGAGYDAAEAMGVLPRLREAAYDVREAAYVDQDGRQRARILLEQFAKPVGGRLLSILRPDLESALREQLPDTVDLRFSTSITRIDNESDGVRVALTDGTAIDADVLVGADGIHSTIRHRIFGPEQRYLRYLGFHTAAFTVAAPEIHAELRDRFTLTDTVNRQMGVYRLGDDRVAAFAVHRTPDPTRPHDARSALRDEYGSLGWVVPRMLAHCPPAAEIYYDQVAQIEMPTWSRGRVTLVGDSCFAVSLLAGQGASLGIGGAYVLADQLTHAPTFDAALERYEDLWRPVVLEKQRTARGGAHWFLPRSRTQLAIRRLALRLARIPGLDRYVAATLAGKSTAIIQELHAARQERASTAG